MNSAQKSPENLSGILNKPLAKLIVRISGYPLFQFIRYEVSVINPRTEFPVINAGCVRLLQERDSIVAELSGLNLPNINVTDDIQTITKQWCTGKIGNFEYLTKLNKEAGRSFNDLMQYPVMPFILADYTNQIIDLESSSSYR